MIKTAACFLICVVCITATISAQSLHQIKEWQDRRNAASLVKALDDTSLAQPALLALASVQDTLGMKRILQWLASPDPRTRAVAAFAAGQTGREMSDVKTAERLLFSALKIETVADVKKKLMEALGKFGDAAALDSLCMIQEVLPDLQSAQALSIGRFAVRGVKSVAAAEKVLRLYATANPQWPCSYALMRLGTPQLLLPYETLLVQMCHNANADVRMFAITALARSGSAKAESELIKAMSDTDYRVGVSAIRGIGMLSPEKIANVTTLTASLLRELDSPNYHLVKTALQILPTLGTSPRSGSTPFRTELDTSSVSVKLVTLAKSHGSPDIRNEALLTLSQLFPDSSVRLITRYLTKKDITPTLLVALGNAAEKIGVTETDMTILEKQTHNANAATAVAALEAIGKCWKAVRKTPDKKISDKVFEDIFIQSLLQPDLSVRATAAGILADSMFVKQSFGKPIAKALAACKSPTDAEAIAALAEALALTTDTSAATSLEKFFGDENLTVRLSTRKAYEKLTGQIAPIEKEPTPVIKKYNWTSIDKLQRTARISTTKGVITIDLFVDEATFTVESFIRLKEKYFYNGTPFHRVVSNFVVQGGDPRGDGWGGPTYTIRSEFPMRNFERGTVGMASAGKDTEGSQLFICHSNQPHLDGRYTIFGKVTDGFDVVDKLEIGDKILHIE
jgi:cyclophilin family peptidyl-prolyl cis-trans isomerase/HEAT repeat protein